MDVTDLDNPQNVNLFLARIKKGKAPEPSDESFTSSLSTTPEQTQVQGVSVEPYFPTVWRSF